MLHIIINIFPWIISILTIWMMVDIGNKNIRGWYVGLFTQVLWTIWQVVIGARGFALLNIVMYFVCARNIYIWKSEK